MSDDDSRTGPPARPADPVARAAAAAREAGQHCAVLDLAGVRDKAGFLDACAAQLGLPGWFGRNWDALADLLGDPDSLPLADGGVLVVRGWRELAAASPGDWATARTLLGDSAADARESGRGVTALLALEGEG
ncbi:barnase inhibitor [Streptomyces albidoflavus]|uniref:barstar family protein n=1 Tax=Streptomyces albidoflavus TaxID=1886 RepID=UPI000BAE29FF|nr:barstar family protein [Streptomyces albidoflavus]PAX83934.1 barnase inhibitor [Streptomyces albidoflavus]PAX89425.1 barnase inhibitor [Streptomyces albidoflavus]PBO16789.1 barnase inhibitor [Streptomyces albidoflavus]PBO22379.1 barnase inhibitor [Streptomyces albidoflavus]PBO30390.1 barnase inhibitor [Streptomyces albidoflavus]